MRAERRARELVAFEREFSEMIDVIRADKYRRAALGEIVFTDPLSAIPHHVMCQRILEWNL